MDTFRAERPVDMTAMNAAAAVYDTGAAFAVLMEAVNECMDQISQEVEQQGVKPTGLAPLPQITVVVTWSQ